MQLDRNKYNIKADKYLNHHSTSFCHQSNTFEMTAGYGYKGVYTDKDFVDKSAEDVHKLVSEGLEGLFPRDKKGKFYQYSDNDSYPLLLVVPDGKGTFGLLIPKSKDKETKYKLVGSGDGCIIM